MKRLLITEEKTEATKRNGPLYEHSKIFKRMPHTQSKVFKPRNSLLTDLYEDNKHCRSMYSFLVVMFICLLWHKALQEYFYEGRITLGIPRVLRWLAHFHILLLIWFQMFLGILAVYLGFFIWRQMRILLSPKSLEQKLWDISWLILSVIFHLCFIYFSTSAFIMYHNQTTILESILGLIEVTRLLMKSYAFLRTNVPKVLRYSFKECCSIFESNFYRYLYFLFAPTLIYRDSYPRTQNIRWCYVATCVLTFIAVLLCMGLISERYVYIPFHDIGIKRIYHWYDILLIIIANMLPVFAIVNLGHYLLLHLWMNAFAEILRFADRCFYRDWWCSTTLHQFHRTWNVIVQDWLHAYVYKDFQEMVTPNSKVPPALFVFLISCIGHEYIFIFGFKFYAAPLCSVFVGLSLVFFFYFTFKNSIVGNISVVLMLCFGHSTNVVFFTIEYYSRVNCPIKDFNISDYFVPRFLVCNKFV